MPVSIQRTTFSEDRRSISLRTPQARVLAALMPTYPDDPVSEWPLVTRAQLGVRAGYTAISGTVTRALNGIHNGSSSGDPHPGLLALGLVKETTLNLDGTTEINYRVTTTGIRAYRVHLAAHGGKLSKVRDAAICTNDRYKLNIA